MRRRAGLLRDRPTGDLTALDAPVLLLYGEDVRIVPIGAASENAISLLKGGTLKADPARPHGIARGYQVEVARNVLDVIRS